MIGPALQGSIFDALTSAGIASGRIYDRVPDDAVFPYVTIGDEQVLDDGNSCADGWEVYPDVHLWSRPDSGSKGEVKTMAASAVAAVLAITSVSGFSVTSIALETARFLRDPDGITEHGVLTFKILLDAE